MTEELSYVADQDCTARFVFPLPPRSAVHSFEATIGDRKIVTEVKSKDKAQKEFDEAVSQGHSAVQMKQQPGAALYCIQLGNLSAMEEAVIKFSYVRILNTVAGAVEFEHQATWVPPYLGASDLQPNGEPTPQAVEANPTFAPASQLSYTLSYDISVQSGRGIRSVESPSEIKVTETEDGKRKVHIKESGECRQVASMQRQRTLSRYLGSRELAPHSLHPVPSCCPQ